MYLEQNIDKAQVLITGSSHAYYGIKPQMLGANVGKRCDSLAMHLMMVK